MYSDHQQIRPFDRFALARELGHATLGVSGRVTDIVGNLIEASLPSTKLGSLVQIDAPGKGGHILAEVVGFREDHTLLLPYSGLQGIGSGAQVKPQRLLNKFPAGEFLLGQVFDPFANNLGTNGQWIPDSAVLVPIDRSAPNPMARNRITKPLSLGIRAIDGLLTFGDGQRVGIMAGSGVGKSMLMGMIAQSTEADINVIGLIGERGREVREFLERDLGPDGLRKSVVVAVTGDQSPLMKIRAAKVTTAIAEYFSSLGNHVLLMMDSLTRVAMAQREIGLAVGEPPTTKGYTPSVFSLLPNLLERTGPQPGDAGNISALYTVLVDGDDFNDPIADAARSILDGQINLTRGLASKGHYPAIDISSSVSRVMTDIVAPEHWRVANKIKGLLGTYLENQDVIQIGAYHRGTNPMLDEAIDNMPAINRFLQQDVSDRSTLNRALRDLENLLNKDSGQVNEDGLIVEAPPR